MVPKEFHEFFVASGSAAAALVGLLFVAVSVAGERTEGHDLAVPLQVRASAALVAFNNVLLVSLFALIPTSRVGWAVVVVAASGLVFTLGGARRLLSSDDGPLRRNAVLVIGLLTIFGFEIYDGIGLLRSPSDTDTTGALAVLLVLSIAVGVARAWELVGLHGTGVLSSLRTIVQRPRQRDRH